MYHIKRPNKGKKSDVLYFYDEQEAHETAIQFQWDYKGPVEVENGTYGEPKGKIVSKKDSPKSKEEV